ncbi:expressed unknown protein [Seminavis robusta]|uniref:Uncharacterized protein n=1 Tax=Seminavis robusta TaxID=568900 RepID=A0A9N8EAQ2_9STRA|nr:expressed unknown protein [Seminavis robusta]|eukprot:Sro685_g186860.1 n/a (157) ;mRNA; r:10651-11121
MVERKPVTKKPSWLTGVIVPTIAGIPVGFVLQNIMASLAWYVLAGWQAMFAVALVAERAPVYGTTSIPQARRLCELYGLSWLGMTLVTLLAMAELPNNNTLAIYMLAINLVCTYGFSIAAGPIRLVNANDNEMMLVPINSFVVAWASTGLYLSATT